MKALFIARLKIQFCNDLQEAYLHIDQVIPFLFASENCPGETECSNPEISAVKTDTCGSLDRALYGINRALPNVVRRLLDDRVLFYSCRPEVRDEPAC